MSIKDSFSYFSTHRTTIIFTTIMCFALLGCKISAPLMNQSTALDSASELRLKVTTFDRESQYSLKGCTVRLFNFTDTSIHEIMSITDLFGNDFNFDLIPGQSYKVSIEHPDFLPSDPIYVETDDSDDGVISKRYYLEAAPSPYEADGFSTIEVLFATDRNQTALTGPGKKFGTKRGETISYGTCQVSIPAVHKSGHLEAPSFWRFQFQENPEQHIVLLNSSLQSETSFIDLLNSRLSTSPESRAFIFVHGYNVTFEDAARRTAQMAFDLNFEGVPMFYSWPSQGNLVGYNTDEGNVEWTESNLTKFLESIFSHTKAENIYLIAHSMGNRAMTRVTARLLEENVDIRSRLKEIILAAPDIDADVFTNDIAPRLASFGHPITLYASSEDKALLASKKIHGGYTRLGDLADNLFIYDGIETIDASGTNTGFLEHSYYAGSNRVLRDLVGIIKEGLRAKGRPGLKELRSPDGGSYWVLSY